MTEHSKKILKDLRDVNKVFEHFKVQTFLVYGALLGAVREKDFIQHDDDVDLVITQKIDLQTRKAIGWMLYDLGFKPQPIMFNVFGRMEPSEIGYNGDGETGILVFERNFKFSLFFFKEEDCPKHGKEMVCIPKLGAVRLISSPSRFYEKPTKIKLHGDTYWAPSPIKEYLEYTYGDWQNPLSKKHADTWFVAHQDDPASLDLENKNEVIIYNK